MFSGHTCLPTGGCIIAFLYIGVCLRKLVDIGDFLTFFLCHKYTNYFWNIAICRKFLEICRLNFFVAFHENPLHQHFWIFDIGRSHKFWRENQG
jgi:hypothetical protein